MSRRTSKAAAVALAAGVAGTLTAALLAPAAPAAPPPTTVDSGNSCPYFSAPAASITSSDTTPAAGEPVTFTATAHNPDGSAVSGYTWVYGDEPAGTAPTPGPATTTHTFARAGFYMVSVHVENCAGTSSAEVDETVHSAPASTPPERLSVTPSRVRAGRRVTLRITLTPAHAGTATVNHHRVILGATGHGTLHTRFTRPGTYAVRLTAPAGMSAHPAQLRVTRP